MSLLYILLVVVAALFVLLLVELQDYNIEDILDTKENTHEEDSSHPDSTDNTR